MKKLIHPFIVSGLVAATLLVAAGCATNKPAQKPVVAFFPPPPDAPRLQFLTGFASEKMFRGHEEKNIMTYLTGAQVPDKEISKPYGIAAGNHRLYICDTGARAVLVLDFETRRLGAIRAEGEGELKSPLNVCLDEDGNCYVADNGRDQVLAFDRNGNYISAIGKSGELKPRDVLVKNGRIYIADLQTHNVHVYDKQSHNKILDIPSSQDVTNKTKGLFTPTNLAMDSKGQLYVSDSGAFRIQVYDAQGNYIRSIGEMGDSLGQFARVKGIAVDKADRLYAVDAMSQVTQVFENGGKLLMWFAEPGDTKYPILPTKVAVDYEDVGAFEQFASPNFKVEHLVFVVNQLGLHKVSVYGFGHKR